MANIQTFYILFQVQNEQGIVVHSPELAWESEVSGTCLSCLFKIIFGHPQASPRGLWWPYRSSIGATVGNENRPRDRLIDILFKPNQGMNTNPY